ncbi:MAG: hypothetical protein IKB79_02520 [Oscillospiraceae bacterium]|nr:hypothetical protein [Oscillospiraceae bacterium]
MTDKECLWHLHNIKLFCSAQQVLAVDRAAALLVQKMKQDKKTPLP